ncbi:hypothetical protein [Haloarcula sediminis]|uniref:hypothetical protein n=1 Tax=Haloarcula sediminis TaxID=3111777 RepID=UPI002D794336|nr:hypothetical protein [Haloarcula sp. CK38]
MPKKEKRRMSRRSWLQAAGASGLAALAGCSSGGGSTSNEVNITLAPSGFQGIMMDHIANDTNILADEMEAAGYQANVQRSWEGAPLFAAGGPDISTMSSLEAARIGAERDLDLAVFGRVAPLFKGMWVPRGGQYDPESTGGAQATIDAIAEDSATVGIGSWAGGEIPGYMAAFNTEFGYTFSQEQSDFNAITADYSAIPQLMLDGDLAIGDASPVHGIARHLDESGTPQHREVFNCAATLEANDIGIPLLNSLTTNQSFLEENEEAAAAFLRAWHEGMAWLFEDPMGRIMSDEEGHFEQLAVTTEAQAQYIADWGINMSLDNEYPIVYEDQELTDSFIEEDRGFINRVAELGVAPRKLGRKRQLC